MGFLDFLTGSGKSSYTAQPYTGYKLPAPTFLKPSEKLIWDTLRARSQGEGVGFDPKRRLELAELTKSDLARQEEDQLREAQGRLASSGLSGNPRAYEALAGRVKRDTGRSLADSLMRLDVEDLTRRNEERDINTGRLQNFYGQQVGQGESKQGMDQSAWATNQGNMQAMAQMNDAAAASKREATKGLISDTLGLVASPFTGGGSMAMMGGGGKGLSPSVAAMYGGFDPKMSSAGGGYRSSYINRNLVR